MSAICNLVKAFPLTTLCVVLIWVLSFFTPPHTPLDNVQMIDKWTHLVMYGGTMGVFWIEYWRGCHTHSLSDRASVRLLVGLVAPVVLGGVIELLQAYCTGGRRSGEWLDWVADTLGVMVAYVLGLTVLRRVCRAVWLRSDKQARAK